MKIIEDFQVEDQFTNTRLDRWLKAKVHKFSQSFIEKSIRAGRIKVNNKKIKSSYRLQGDRKSTRLNSSHPSRSRMPSSA